MIPCITVGFYAKTNSDRPGKAAAAAVGAQLLLFFKSEPLPWALDKKNKKNCSAWVSNRGHENEELVA